MRVAMLRRFDGERRLRAMSLLTSVKAFAIVAILVTSAIVLARRRLREKRACRRKSRMYPHQILSVTSHSTEFEFSVCIRMSRSIFRDVLSKLERVSCEPCE
jgi:hypothetical protein